MPRAAPTPASGSPPPGGRSGAFWIPWLCAPAFILLPIAGCGVAEALGRHAAPGGTAAADHAPPLVPITAVVTILPARR